MYLCIQCEVVLFVKSVGRTFLKHSPISKPPFGWLWKENDALAGYFVPIFFHFKGMNMDTGFPLISFQEIP